MSPFLQRREFLAGLGATALVSRLSGQTDPKHPVVNDDLHGMPMAGMDHEKLAGEDAASEHLLQVRAQVPGSVIPVTTRSYDNYRSGVNYQERTLTPQAIRDAGGLRLLFKIELPGDTRGIEGQQLFVPAVPTGSGTYDLAISATMGNQVYAHDAQTGTPLWMTRLAAPILGSKKIDAKGINNHWGILSTCVIKGYLLYVVSWTSPDGTHQNGSHWFYVIDVRTGVQVASPLQLTKPAPIQRKQRAGLAIVGDLVFIPWGTIQETNDGAHGYITAVDTRAWRIAAEWNATPQGSGGGIWQAGAAPCIDRQGNLVVMTGNGDFNPDKGNFGESFVKIGYGNGAFEVLDWWTPFRDEDRNQGDGWNDMDLGAGAPVIIPEYDLAMGAGKDGILYMLHLSHMGKPKKAGQFELLASPPIWLTYYPGDGVNAAPVNPKELDRLWANKTHHQHGAPVVWKSNAGYRLFCFGENGNARFWAVNKNGTLPFLGKGSEIASPYSPTPPGGMPGAMMTLSANSGSNGVLWCCTPDQNANEVLSNGRVFAYDAMDTGNIQRLWMSGPDHYTYNKFNPPVVNGGKLYIPTYAGSVEVWGL